jgi:hypothetical protein
MKIGIGAMHLYDQPPRDNGKIIHRTICGK